MAFDNFKKEMKGFIKFCCLKKTNRRLLFLVLIFLIFGAWFYFTAQQEAEKILVEQTLHREQVIARAGAKALERFINDDIVSALVFFSTDEKLLNFNSESQQRMKEFINEWQSTSLVEVLLIDSQGEVWYSADRQGIGEIKPGIMVDDREYFKGALNLKEGEVYIGNPIYPRGGPYKGQYELPIIAPIMFNGQLKGFLAGAILLSELTEDFLDPLKISSDTVVHLIDDQGVILYAPVLEAVGENYLDDLMNSDFAYKQESFDILSGRVQQVKEGKADVYLPKYGSEESVRYLIAYSPVNMADRHWILAVATPIDDVLLFFHPFQKGLRLFMVSLVLMLISFSSALIMMVKLVQKDAYLDGYIACRRGLKIKK